MQKRITRLLIILAVFAVALVLRTSAQAQATDDFRSITTGNFGTAGTWERFNGTSWVAAGGAPTSANGAINIRTGNTVTQFSNLQTLDQLTIDSGGQFTVNGGVQWTLGNGAGTDMTVNGTVLSQGGTWTIGSGATWTVAAGGTFIHNTNAGISNALNAATLDAASNFIYRGSNTINSSVSMSGRTYGNVSFESTSGTWITSASGAGTLNTTDFTIGTSVSYSTTQTGTMTFAGNFTNNGTLTNSTGTQVYTFTGVNKTISGGGAIAFETWNIDGGASITLGSLSGNAVSVAVGFTGTVLNGGTLNTGAAANRVTGAGAFTLASGSTFITANATGLDGAVAVTGTETFSTGANYEFRGAATGATLPATVNNLTINNASGDVNLNGAGATQTVGNTLNLLSGNLNANGTRTTVSVAGTGDGIVMRGGTQINSNATVNLTGASGGNVVFDAVNNGTATIAGSLGLGGLTRSFDIGNGSAATDMSVTGLISNGAVTKIGAGALSVSNTSNSYTGGTNVNAGTFALGASNVLADGGAVVVGGGTLDIGANSDTVAAVTMTSGSITGSGGTLTGSSYGVESGNISAKLGGSAALTKSTSGTVVLTGANSYSGTTTLSVNGGTLEINNTNSATSGRLTGTSGISIGSGATLLLSGSSSWTDRIKDTATMTLAGGTFNTGGLSEHGSVGMGALSLTSNSVIDLAAGASIINFADSSDQTWTGTLSIWNWSGTVNFGNGTDQLIFGTSNTALTTTQLNQISFYSDNGMTSLGTAIFAPDNDGEVIPGAVTAVPEPSTWIIGALLAASLLASRRRRFRKVRA